MQVDFVCAHELHLPRSCSQARVTSQRNIARRKRKEKKQQELKRANNLENQKFIFKTAIGDATI